MALSKIFTVAMSYEMDDITHAVTYGRSESGNVVKSMFQFNPYCIVEGLSPGQAKTLAKEESIGVIGVEPVRLKDRTQEKNMYRVTVKTPKDVPLVRKWVPASAVMYSADILYPLRFMYSTGYSAFTTLNGHGKNLKYPTFIDPVFSKCDYFNAPLKILSFDIENSIKNGTVFVIGVATQTMFKDDYKTYSFVNVGDEADCIRAFLSFVKEYDPDIITGYNIDGYDWPHLQKRCEILNITLPIGRDNSGLLIYNSNNQMKGSHIKIVGRVSFDAYKMVRRSLKPVNEDLGYVAKELGVGDKHNVDSSQIDRYWDEDRPGVIQYCENDALLVLKIVNHPRANFIYRAMVTSYNSGLPLEETINPVSSRIIDSLLIPKYEARGYATPMHRRMNKWEDDDEDEEKYKGAYCREQVPGSYSMVAVLDFSSMYPSEIIKYNMDWITYHEDKDMARPNEQFYFVEVKEGRNVGTHRFLKPDIIQGVIPETMKWLMKWRKDVKALMKQAERDGNKDLAKFYDVVQTSIKEDFTNAMYGVLGSDFYRYSREEIAECVTASAQGDIKDRIETIENKGYTVLYSDTDSVFVLTGYDDVVGAKRFAETLAKELSQDVMVMELEDIFDPWFNHGKKKFYIGKSAITGKVKIRGYALRRRDSFQKQREILQYILDKILDKCDDMDSVFSHVKDDLYRMRTTNVDTDTLILSRTCKDESEYEYPERMPQVHASRQLKALGIPFTPGQRVRWIVVDGQCTPMKVEPVIEGKPLPKPDYEYYVDRIIKTIQEVADLYGWDVQALKTGMKQKNIFQFG